jgi:hypothetical protein
MPMGEPPDEELAAPPSPGMLAVGGEVSSEPQPDMKKQTADAANSVKQGDVNRMTRASLRGRTF